MLQARCRKTHMLTIAVGDIHGMANKLRLLLDRIDDWRKLNSESEPHQFVFLGDYIDRGPELA